MFRAPQWHGATQTHFPPRPRKSQWHCDITNVASPHGLPTHLKQTYHMIPQIIPLTSDTPRLRQRVSRSRLARRHANALSIKAAQIPMAQRHHERRVATRSAQILEANMSHDTANHPAHQRHAPFTPACYALPGGTAPRKHTSHPGRPNPEGTATSRTSRRHTVCPHTSRRAFRTRLPPKVKAARRAFRTRLPPKVTHQVSKTSVSHETSSKSHTSSLQNERFVRDSLQKSRIKFAKQAFRTRLPPKLTRQVSKTSVSCETSSKSHTSSLQNERFVQDFLKNSHVKVSKTSVSYETSSKTHTSKSAKRAFRTRLPPKVKRKHPSEHTHKSCQAVSRFQPLQKTPAHTPIPM